MSQQSYSDLERSASKSTTKIGSLAKELGVDAYWLETGEGQMEPLGVGESHATYLPYEKRRILELLDALSERQRRGLLDLLNDGA